MMNSIETNPQMLRKIAHELKEYGQAQIAIISEYLHSLKCLEEKIDIEGYRLILEEVEKEKQILEDIHGLSTMQFVRFLMEKADLLEQYGQVEIKLNYWRNDSTGEVAHLFGATDRYMRNINASAFANGEYQTVEVKEPMVVYRYFGSYEIPSSQNYANNNYTRCPVSIFHKNVEENQVMGWGSSAGGQWCSPIQTNDPQYVQDILALKQAWGNDVEAVAEILIPKGTVISIGKAASQGKLRGGGTQIFIHEKSETIMNWITRCGKIEYFDFKREEKD